MGWSSILLKCLFVRFKVLLSFSKHWHPNTGQITLVINFCTFRNKEKQIRVVAKHISHPVEYQLKGVFVKFNLKKLILNNNSYTVMIKELIRLSEEKEKINSYT